MVHFDDLRSSLKSGFKIVVSTSRFAYSILAISVLYLIISKSTLVLGASEAFLSFFTLLLLAMAFSLFMGAIFCHRITVHSHIVWNLLGLIFGISLFFQLSDFIGFLFYSLLGGFSLGLCVPCMINSLISLTTFDNRGSVSGIFTMCLFLVIGSELILARSIIDLAVIVIVTKVLSLIINLRMKNWKSWKVSGGEEFTSVSPWIKLSFILSWCIFLLVDAVTSSVLYQFSSIAFLVQQSIFIGLVSMVIGGILLDHVGRKKLILFSYALIGMVFAMVTISDGNLLPLTFFDGIPWGILTVFFIMVLWGDVCFTTERPLYIAAALMIALFEILIRDYLQTINLGLSIANVFPIASIFLFIAAFVILILPETLPEKVIQNRELKEYIRSAKKIKEKFGKD